MSDHDTGNEPNGIESAAEKNAKPVGASPYPSGPYAWYTVILLLVIYTFSFIDRNIVGLMGAELIAEFNLSQAQFGLLGGLAFALFYATFGLFFARISDTSSRKWLIAIGLTLWSLMTALSALTRNYTQLFLCRVGVGVGEATLSPAANSLIADSFPKEKLSTALSVYAMGIPVGSALAYIIGGQVIAYANQLPDFVWLTGEPLKVWQKSFIIVGLPGLLLTGLIALLKEPTRKSLNAGKAASTEKMPVSEVWTYIRMRGRAYGGIVFGASFIAFVGFGTLIWLPVFFGQYFKLSPQSFAATFGIIALISGPIGLILGGQLADRLYAKGRRDGHMIAILISPIGFVVPAILVTQLADLSIIWVIVFFSNMFMNLPSGAAYASLQLITPNRMRGQVVALYVLMTNIIGYAGGAYFIGAVADSVGGAEGLRIGLLSIAIVGTPISIMFLLWGRKAYAKALEDVENTPV